MKYTIDIDTNELSLEVQLNVYIEKDEGIGGYEYWGYRGYDSGSGELFVSDINWDNTKYTPDQNNIISRYLDENKDDIESEIIKSCKM